jgi:2,3-diketo-5-methylthiopentyl-1-phosphate enolase
LGVYNRPLVNNMIKPCTGIDPKTTAKLAYEAAVGGTDIIKDDELVADAKHCPLVDRVKAVMEALKRADEEKGEKTIFTFNITDRTEKLRDNAYRAIEAGANGLMLNYFPIGLDAARMICEDPNIKVPVLAHADFTGAVYESPWSGLSAKLIRGKLVRLAGLDVCLLSSPYGKFPNLMDTIFNMALTITTPLQHIKPTFPAISGGTMQGHVEEIINQFGDDVVIAAGGAVHGHPMGARAGAKAFRQAIGAVKSGMSLEEAGKKHKELGMVLDAWGIYKPHKKSGLFDIKS